MPRRLVPKPTRLALKPSRLHGALTLATSKPSRRSKPPAPVWMNSGCSPDRRVLCRQISPVLVRPGPAARAVTRARVALALPPSRRSTQGPNRLRPLLLPRLRPSQMRLRSPMTDSSIWRSSDFWFWRRLSRSPPSCSGVRRLRFRPKGRTRMRPRLGWCLRWRCPPTASPTVQLRRRACE